MRVISGVAKGHKLSTVKGNTTRPTTDKLKETLFNIINRHVEQSIFLDLFSGSGAIGIEALSRGARECYFVDNSKKCCDIILKNLEKTKLSSKYKIINKDCYAALNYIKKSFDIIFMDPPYNKYNLYDLLNMIIELNLLNDGGIIIAEHATGDILSSTDELEIFRVKIYKTTTFSFIRRMEVL